MSMRRKRGFTLVEVLIALVLMSMAMALMMAGLRYSAKAWSSAEQRIDTLTDLQATRRIMNSTLGAAFPTITGEGDSKRFLFEGESGAVTFTTYMPPYPDQAGLYLIKLFIIKHEGSYQLRLKRALLTPDIRPLSDWSSEEDVLVWQSGWPLSFAYFGSSDESEHWQNQWDGSIQIPQLVKLQIESGGDESAARVEIITPIKINIDNHCITRAEDGLCRLPLEGSVL
jgi:general secretion pathway protein J